MCATWIGFGSITFVIDVFSRMIVSWRAVCSMTDELTLEELEQAFSVRLVKGNLIHDSDGSTGLITDGFSNRSATYPL